MNETRELSLDDIESLAVGAWILGTGGGGSPYLGLLNMRQLYAAGHRVRLISPASLDDTDTIAVVSNQGAPLVGQERLTDSRTMARAVALMEEITGVQFQAIMSLEIGGGNSIQPLMAAAHLDRPVVDADCMGRAYPEAQMTSFAVGDLKPYPLTSSIPEVWNRSSIKCPPGNGWNASAARYVLSMDQSPQPARHREAALKSNAGRFRIPPPRPLKSARPYATHSSCIMIRSKPSFVSNQAKDSTAGR